MLLYVSCLTLVTPITPTLMTDFFASRNSPVALFCEDYPPNQAPQACRDAHSTSVIWSSWTSFISNSLLSFLLAPMIGSWTDVYGRKPFMILAFAVTSVHDVVLLLHLNLGVSLLWYFPAQALNGAFSSLTIALSFVSDLMQPRHRAATFGLILASFSVGVLIGPGLGGFLPPVWAAWGAIGGIGFAITYTAVVLPESLSASAKCAARARQDAGVRGLAGRWAAMRILGRSSLFIKLTICVMLSGVVAEGLSDLLIQFFQIKLGFTTQDQAMVFIVYGGCGLLVNTILLRFLLLYLGETRVLVFGLLSSTVAQTVLAFSVNRGMAFSALAISSLGYTAFPAISSIKANNVHDYEQGTIQGALYGARSLAQGVGPLIFAALFSAFTRSDSPLPYFPGAPFLFGVALMLVALGVAATIDTRAGEGRQLLVDGASSGDEEDGQLPAEDGRAFVRRARAVSKRDAAALPAETVALLAESEVWPEV
ncbi:hypothetical protein WJX72_006405 [[Myrmecia] bisecta]|uniref:Major facilitator superfamily (MFS) profile domain-containing protein n=1 Tax=[Myrmecia] bisecta TaxID=41462 RepID=A0AAW1PBY7_9CHLO